MLQFDLPHVRMSALAWGNENDRLALCVHGFPDSAHGWRELAPMLAANGFRVIAPFTRGYAPTGPAPDGDYHAAALATDMIDLNERLGGRRDSVFVGHDWGAFTCHALAAFDGSPFQAYVAMAVPPIAAIDNSRHGAVKNLRLAAIQLRRSWYVMFFQIPFLPERVLPHVVPRLWKDWSPRGTDVGDDVRRSLDALPNLGHRKAAVGYYRAMVRFTHPSAPYAALHPFRFALPTEPILVLHGERDGAFQTAYLDGVLDALPSGSRVETISDAGHFLQVDQPAAVCTAILGYLDSLPDPRCG